MATPRLPPGPAKSTSPNLIFAVKVLFVLIIILLLPKFVIARRTESSFKKKYKRLDQQIRAIRSVCEEEVCVAFIPEESMNCVNNCISPSCYEMIYGLNPLEDGEIDITRAESYDKCLKEELRAARKRRTS